MKRKNRIRLLNKLIEQETRRQRTMKRRAQHNLPRITTADRQERTRGYRW